MQTRQVIATDNVIDLLWGKAAFEILYRLDCVGGAALAYFKITHYHFWEWSEYLFEPSKTQMWQCDEGFFERIEIGWHDDEQIDRKLLQSPSYDL